MEVVVLDVARRGGLFYCDLGLAVFSCQCRASPLVHVNRGLRFQGLFALVKTRR